MKNYWIIPLLLLALPTMAQRIPVDPKFGKVSDLEMDMTTYEPDTAATALVLYSEDDVHLVIDIDLGVRLRHKTHERIKILKESGRDYADYRLYYRTDNDMGENVRGIKVSTFNREGKKLVETKLDRKMIFDEPYRDGVKSISFSAPNVKVGSVVEVEFEQETNVFYDLPQVYLQRSIPVNKAIAVYTIPEYFSARKMSRGTEPIDYEDKEDVASSAVLQFNNRIETFTVQDLPALRPEGLAYNMDQYMASVDYSLSQFQYPGTAPRNFSSTWPDVDKAICQTAIWTETKARCRFRDEVLALQGQDMEEKAFIVAVRDLVLGKVEWDGTRSMIPGRNAETLRKRSGTAADINALTGSALNDAGYETEPVMIRRRSSGYLPEFHVSLSAYDLFILRIKGPSGTVYYLDAAPKEGYVNVLDDNYLIPNARLVHGEDVPGEWVDLTGLAANQLIVSNEMTLSPDGLLSGKMVAQAANQHSYSLKESYGSYKSMDEFIEEEETEEGVEIVSMDLDGIDEYTQGVTLTEEYERHYDTAGERIYLSPFATKFHNRSTFRSETRKTPLEFPYKQRIAYQVKIRVPESYEIEELPAGDAFTNDDIKARVQFSSSLLQDGQIQVTLVYQQNETFATADEYPGIRAFWERLCGIYDKTIVLKKKP